MPELMTHDKLKSSEQIDLDEAENVYMGKDYKIVRVLLEKLHLWTKVFPSPYSHLVIFTQPYFT